MLKTTLTFHDKRTLMDFIASQQETYMEETDTSLTGYFEPEQIHQASEQFGATVLQVEDGRPTNDQGSLQENEPLI